MQPEITVRRLRASGSAGSYRADQPLLSFGSGGHGSEGLLIIVEEESEAFGYYLKALVTTVFHLLEHIFALAYFLFSLR